MCLALHTAFSLDESSSSCSLLLYRQEESHFFFCSLSLHSFKSLTSFWHLDHLRSFSPTHTYSSSMYALAHVSLSIMADMSKSAPPPKLVLLLPWCKFEGACAIISSLLGPEVEDEGCGAELPIVAAEFARNMRISRVRSFQRIVAKKKSRSRQTNHSAEQSTEQ